MPNIENDAKKRIAELSGAITIERRRLAARALDWLKRHPRTLVAIVAVLVLIAVALGLARG
jgi:hypothetical protein